MKMSQYLAACFNRSAYPSVLQLLKQRKHPIASFYTTLEEFALTKNILCCWCGYLIEDLPKTKCDDVEKLYVFIETDPETLAHLFSKIIALDGVHLACFAHTWASLLVDSFHLKCSHCRKEEVELKEKASATAKGEIEKAERIRPLPVEVTGNLEQDENGRASKLVRFKPTHQVSTGVRGNVSSVQDEFGSSNSEYQWTKCKLCMRILRTKRADASRMRTLQMSHVRNHVSKMQFSCLLCPFGCRFHGGIQLHMSRTHPHNPTQFMDRSKDASYRKEIATLKVTCFGTSAH